MEIKKFPDSETAAKVLGYELTKRLMELKGKKTLLLLSGGSSFEPLKYVDVDIFGDYLTIGVLDERFNNGGDNNFFQLTQTDFYKVAKEMGCKFIDTQASKFSSKEELADYFEKSLRDWIKNNSDGVIIATMGMGEDGHTSGIMPYPDDPGRFKEVFGGDRWVVSYDAGSKNQFPLRITTTMIFLRKINYAFGFICGDKKKGAFKRIKSDVKINELPIKIVEEMPEVIIYSDISV